MTDLIGSAASPWEAAARMFEPTPVSPYLKDPVKWVEDKLGETLWSKQREVCESVVVNRKTAVRSCHNAGKSRVASRIASWFIDVHPPGEAFIVSTAPTYSQVHGILWEEIRNAAKVAESRGNPLPGRVLGSDQWKLDDGTLVGWGRKPADTDQHGFQGIHRRYVLVVVDEACHDDQTEVLTEFGWRLFSSLTGNERLLTMDQGTHQASYRFPERIVAKPYRGKMHLYEAKGANFCVTPDHDMYFHGRSHNRDTYWRKAPMSELSGKDNKYLKKTIVWNAPDVATFTIPELHSARKYFPPRVVDMDDWMRFLGWYLSEGHIITTGRPYVTGAGISQKDPVVLREIYDLCIRLGFPAKYYPNSNQVNIHCSQIGRHLVEYGKSCLEKTVPDYARMVSVRQMNLMLDEYVRGDGYRKGKGDIIYTSSPSMADALQEVILKTGRPSVVRRRALQGQVNDFGSHTATSSVDGYVVTRPHADSETKYYAKNDRLVDYNGMVYCASVPPEAMLFTRRNGYTMWSGNCGVPRQLWTAVEAITTGANVTILALGNPDDPNTEFADVCKPGSGWNSIRISAFDTPNLSGEKIPESLTPMMLDPEWVEDKRKRWGETSPRYVSKVLGEFPDIGEDVLISPALIRAAQERVLDPGPWSVLGVDVARYGSDRTIFCLRQGPVARIVGDHSTQSTMETTGKVIAAARDHSVAEIRVDGVGVGGGVVDRLLEQGHDVVDMQAGSGAVDSEHFLNSRAEWAWAIRTRMEDSDLDLDPEDDDLAAQLGALRYKFTSRGQIQIESKDEMRRRGLPSPDRADALMLTAASVAPIDQIVEPDEDEGPPEGSISSY